MEEREKPGDCEVHREEGDQDRGFLESTTDFLTALPIPHRCPSLSHKPVAAP